jgi:hypothetical protein
MENVQKIKLLNASLFKNFKNFNSRDPKTVKVLGYSSLSFGWLS